jgi:LysM repeat protein
LLVVLFIAALTTEEESVPQIALMQETAPQPLFTEPVDLGIKPPPLPEHTTLSDAPSTPAVILPNLAATDNPTPVSPPVSLPAEPGYMEVAVKKGDSLDKIAKAHHTTVDELIKLNHLPSSFLRIGQVLKVPSDKIWTAAPKPKPTVETSSSEYYTIKVGDNPWTIAMKHHMKLEELLKLNSLNEEKARKLKPGDRLRIR